MTLLKELEIAKMVKEILQFPVLLHPVIMVRILNFPTLIKPLCSDGCPWDDSSDIFHQNEEIDNPVLNWSWNFTSDITTVPNHLGWPNYNHMPDAHISSIRARIFFIFPHQLNIHFQNPYTGKWLLFYPHSASYRSIGSGPLPEQADKLKPPTKILGWSRNPDERQKKI